MQYKLQYGTINQKGVFNMSIKIFVLICFAIAILCNLTIAFVKIPVNLPKNKASVLKYCSFMTAILLIIIIGILIKIGFLF